MACRRRSSWAAAGSLRMSTCLMPAQFGASQPHLKTKRAGSITGWRAAHGRLLGSRSSTSPNVGAQTAFRHGSRPLITMGMRRTAMPAYIAFGNWTDQGMRAIADSPRRLDEAKRQLEEMGGRFIAFWM